MQEDSRRVLGYGGMIKRVLTTIGESNPFEQSYLSQLFHKQRYRALVTIIRWLSKGYVNTLLDVGCGRGFLYRFLLQSGVLVDEYICLDLDYTKLESACGMRICADAHVMPVNTCSVDFTVASEVLEHLDKPILALKEMIDATREYLVLSFPDEIIKDALGFKYPEHVSRVNFREVISLAERYGFKLLLHYVLKYPLPPSIYDKLFSYNYRTLRLLESVQKTLKVVGFLNMIKTHVIVLRRLDKCTA